MSSGLKYMPIFRSREEEDKILEYFDFGDRIYPCIEIIKELDRTQPLPNQNAKKAGPLKEPKQFASVYGPLIRKIRAKQVFVDLPVHLIESDKMKPATFNFFRKVVSKMDERTEYMKKLVPWASQIIPVISTYYDRSGIPGTITWQERELRPHYKTIAFRTFMKTFAQDVMQIEAVLKESDYLIMDWQEEPLDLNDGDQMDIVERLKKMNCIVITHRNPISNDLTNVGLEHGDIVNDIDNRLLVRYKEFGGSCFSDYAGIKKDNIGKGGVTSPGFVYYDAILNEFFGYRFKNGGHKKGETLPDIEEFETRIVPAVITSEASKRMLSNGLPYLGTANQGWRIINNIKSKREKGKSAAKFKRIGMEHYLHCIKIRILNGDFD